MYSMRRQTRPVHHAPSLSRIVATRGWCRVPRRGICKSLLAQSQSQNRHQNIRKPCPRLLYTIAYPTITCPIRHPQRSILASSTRTRYCGCERKRQKRLDVHELSIPEMCSWRQCANNSSMKLLTFLRPVSEYLLPT